MAPSILNDNCVTYFICVFCKETGVARYPTEQHYAITGTTPYEGNLYAGAITCYTCTRDPSNYNAMQHYVHNEIDISHIKSSWIYKEVAKRYGVSPSVITIDEGAALLDIDYLLSNLTNTCALYSITYTSNGLTRTSPDSSFYGNLGFE